MTIIKVFRLSWNSTRSSIYLVDRVIFHLQKHVSKRAVFKEEHQLNSSFVNDDKLIASVPQHSVFQSRITKNLEWDVCNITSLRVN